MQFLRKVFCRAKYRQQRSKRSPRRSQQVLKACKLPFRRRNLICHTEVCEQSRFRWASLQLESLQKLKSEENVIKELARLPPTLSATYAKIYSRMSETDTSQIAVRALRLLACSQKPIAASALSDSRMPSTSEGN